MATKTGSRDAVDAARAAVDRIRELNERIIDNARRGGAVYLDVYERSLKALIEYQTAVAGATPNEWLKQTVDTQAAFMRELGDLYATTARDAMTRN